MKLAEAVAYLRGAGAEVKPSNKRTKRGTLYQVSDKDSRSVPMWVSAKALCSLAKLIKRYDQR